MKTNNQPTLNVSIQYSIYLQFVEKHQAQLVPSWLFSSVEPVGGWFIPGTGSLCPPASPHSQSGGPISLSPSHGCERYSTLRNHRSAPYTSPYAHRTDSPSECPHSTFYLHTARKRNTTSSPAINKKRKQMLQSEECCAFLWLLCEWSHRAVNGWVSDEECTGRRFTPLTGMATDIRGSNPEITL